MLTKRGARGHGISVAASRVRADVAFAVVDVVIVVAAYALGLAIRMLDAGVSNPQAFWADLFRFLPFIAAVHLTANAAAGAYGHVWEHASMSEALRVLVASVGSTLVVLVVSLLVREPFDIVLPIATVVLGGFFSLALMGLVRFRSRLFSLRRRSGGPRILIVGDGPDAVGFARRAPEVTGGTVTGFVVDHEVDDSPRRLADLPVLGSLDELPAIVETYEVDQVVVVGRDPARLSGVVDRAAPTDAELRVLPAAGDVLGDGESLVDPRDIRVEDLLARDAVVTDLARIHELLAGRRVLVTGAGGSIGSEIVRQVCRFGPSEVWALDRDETLLHEGGLTWECDVRPILADIRDAGAIGRAFSRIRPEVVFHAAALKHVPVLEANPEEAALTNVVGTANVMQAGSISGVSHFVLISTDKAVQPTSVMGATKRVAELLVKSAHERDDGCTYTAVRFGNVLGSRGSVVPTFAAQIKDGGPITVTDPAMTRYFMTVDEAVQLVLQAATLAKGSELFLLDMGDPVRIDDLARRMVRLSGLMPDRDIEIVYTGARPGEKLEEVLAHGPLLPTSSTAVLEVPLEAPAAAVLADAVARLGEAAASGRQGEVLHLLNDLAEGRLNAVRTVSIDDDQLSISWP